jgi:hypothetical protein
MAPNDSNQTNIAQRYRTLLTLWFAMTMSIVLWLVLIHFVVSTTPVNQRLGLLLVCLGLVPMSASFLVKQVLMGKAIAGQNLMLVQQAYVTSWALCEAAGLLGLLAHFVAASPHYYFGFIIAGIGILLHFPQKKHLLQASGQEF